jgi:type I restriction enzyme R subunit
VKIEWEYRLVEEPFCRQLEVMGWTWTKGDIDVPELTERASFREVFLKDRLATALTRINLRDGEPWLDGRRIAAAINDLEKAPGHSLMEVNQTVTGLLLTGTVTDGLPDWENGRPQPVLYIDFDRPEENDFLVINQFKVEFSSGRGHIILDAVLFVNGMSLVVAESRALT